MGQHVLLLSGFEPCLGQINDNNVVICCFSAKHAALWRKSKDWLAWNWVNVSEWSDMSTRWLMFQWASTIKIQIRVLVYIASGPHLINCNLFLPWYGWKIAHLALNNNHSLTPIAYINLPCVAIFVLYHYII